MGRVYYAQYLVWLELGRTDLLRNLNATYAKWENEKHVYLPVCDCQIKYASPAEYDDLITVETRMMTLSKASVRFEYTVRSQNNQGRLLAEAKTTHAFVDSTGKIIRIADQLLPQFFPAK